MRIQVRIVAGSLRGRKLSYAANDSLRPTPQMVREALFSILGNAIPDRLFVDVFAGTGVVGLEALSRGASAVLFVERDPRLIHEIQHHLQTFNLSDLAEIVRADAYRWSERWQPPGEPVNVFLSPPFPDLQHRLGNLLQMIADLQRSLAPGSVLVIQSERDVVTDKLPARDEWEVRRYGRNQLLIWVKEAGDRSQESGARVDDDSDGGS
jgi:16S rRNA (guanine(966)-N(2))-methyltransferase RsmD